MSSELNLNQATIQLQLSFLIATRSIILADSGGGAAVEVEETGHGQDNKRSAGDWLCLKCGKTLDVCDHKVIKYCERLVKKKNIQE